MVLCPIALLTHCRDCKLVRICPAKRIIGDYGKENESSFSPFSEDDDPLDDTDHFVPWDIYRLDDDDPLD